MNENQQQRQPSDLAAQAAKNTAKKAGKAIGKKGASVGKKILSKVIAKYGIITGLLIIGGVLLVLLISTSIVAIISGNSANSSSSNSSFSNLAVSEEVEQYTDIITTYAEQYGIGNFVPLIKAVMMQESGGQGTDPMQCSECPYNIRYPNVPNGILDPMYSIEVGIHYLSGCLSAAACTDMSDTNNMSLALQGYNYGNGYIAWAQARGGYSKENAQEFSDMMCAKLGWSGYGDPLYVEHVLRYLTTYSSTGVPHEDMANIALSQVGNDYSKYGLASHWCAAFVSWCARQAGIGEDQIQTYYSCWAGIQWFQSQGRFHESAYRGGSYLPVTGDIIFFNWNSILGNDDGNHTGIVVRVENGMVYTVEGNTDGYSAAFWDTSRVTENSYSIGSPYITGYATYN